MAITAELADGRTLEFPDGTDPSVVQRTVKGLITPTPSVKAAPPRPLTRDNPDPISNFIIDKLANAPGLGNAPDIQGSAPGRFIQGMADAPIGALQLGAHLSTAALIPGFTRAIDDRIKEINDRTNGLRGENPGFDWARLGGNLASPLGLAVAAKVPIAATRLGKIGQGAGLGAAGGATAPVTDGGDNFATEKAIQTAVGTVAGASIPAIAPLVTGAAKGVYHGLIEPWAHPAAIKGRAFLEAAGDKADEIINYLRQNKQLVPGSAPTAGEAAVPAGSAEFSALQKQAQSVAPTAYVGRSDQQNAARIAALRTVGQDERALEEAIGARANVANPLYQAARENTVPIDARGVLKSLDSIAAKNPGNDDLTAALAKVRKGLVGPEGRPSYDAQELSSSIDGLKQAIGKATDPFTKTKLVALKDQLEKTIPGYETANSAFKAMSAPVNQMQVGQYLEGKLVPAISDEAKQKAASFAAAVRDAPGTIKRSTGQPRFDELSQVLTPDQMKVVNGIRDDLARGARFEDLARKGSEAAPDISGGMGKQKLPNLLNRHVMLANAIISRLEGKVNKKLAAEMATEMLNPPGVADTLQKAQERATRNKAMATMVQKTIQSLAPSAIGAAQRK